MIAPIGAFYYDIVKEGVAGEGFEKGEVMNG